MKTSNKSIATTLTVFIFIYSVNSASVAEDSTHTEFIRTSCSATTYPALCYSSLSRRATAIHKDPKILAHTALSVCLDTAHSISADMLRISLMAGFSAREAGAMKDCVEELSESVNLIKESMAEMNGIKWSNFEMVISDVQTWVSAALTDDDTCMDGLEFMNGVAKTEVRTRIVNVAHMTSNALALINSYATHHG